MVDQLNAFASEVSRVAREVGTDGKLGGQAAVPGVAGTWKDLTDNVNSMASNLTGQVRNIADVTTAVAKGDLSRKITVDVRGEILELKNTINTMVDQLNGFASEVSRVAREVGTEGKLGGQAQVPGVAGTWKDLTDNVNSMANNLTGQVRNIAEVTTAVARGDLSRKITVDVKGEILELKNTINTMVDQLNAFASEVTPRRARSRHGRKTWRSGGCAGRRRNVEGFDGQRELDGVEFDRTSPQHCRSDDCRGERRLVAQDHGGRARRNSPIERNHQHDGRAVAFVRVRSHARRARGRNRRPARRASGRAGRRRHLERFDGLGERDGRKSHGASPQHRRSDDRRRARRFVAQNHGGRERRNFGIKKHDQHDG